VEDTDEYEELRGEVREVGEDRAEATRELYGRIRDAFDEYREDATGRGDFGRYVEFQNAVIDAEEAVEDEDVYRAEDFKSALGHLDAQTLRDKHFERANDDLSDVGGFVERYERRLELADELRETLSDLEHRADELGDEIGETEEELRKARRAEDTDASPLRDAVETYNERVREDFDGFVSDAPAVGVAHLGERTLDAPLVDDFPVERGAADRLARYVDDETVDRVLELAGSSDGKLAHYVDDTGGFRDAVPRSFFETVSAEPFVLGYEPVGEARRRADELVPIVGEFAGDETVAALREVRDIAANGGYAEMRRAVLAQEEVGAGTEEAEDRLESLREEKDRVERRADELRDALEG